MRNYIDIRGLLRVVGGWGLTSGPTLEHAEIIHYHHIDLVMNRLYIMCQNAQISSAAK